MSMEGKPNSACRKKNGQEVSGQEDNEVTILKPKWYKKLLSAIISNLQC